MAKLKWKVSDVSTGPYRTFFKRGWPSATLNGEMAFSIRCEDDYVPSLIKTGEHAELILSYTDRRDKKFGWTWMTFKKRFATIQEVKEFAQGFADRNPHIFINQGE